MRRQALAKAKARFTKEKIKIVEDMEAKVRDEAVKKAQQDLERIKKMVQQDQKLRRRRWNGLKIFHILNSEVFVNSFDLLCLVWNF